MKRKWSQWKAFQLTVPGTVVGIFLSMSLFTACLERDNPPVILDCPRGQLPCEEDSSDCCPVECPEGFHLGGADSTDCIRDTTSHSFVWELDTFGIYPSGLYDVALVDENDIWAVGDIKTGRFDTTFYNGDTFLTPIHYNAVHWNGSEWELFNIEWNTFGHLVSPELFGIYAVSNSEIWVTSGSPSVSYANGLWENFRLWDMGILGPEDGILTSIWGTSSSNLYFVGDHGTIVHYDGSSFTKMESGTETPLRDIWGLDENHIWISSWTLATYEQESVILEYDNQSFKRKYVSSGFYPVLSDSISGYMYSVWSFEDTLYISCEGGLWKESLSTGVGYLTNRSTVAGKQVYIGKVRGNGYNDVFWLFSWGELYHYNGKTWKNILDLALQYPDVPLGAWGFAVRENMVVFVGNIHGDDQALIVRGQR